jgi:UBX domain-containing protein 6
VETCVDTLCKYLDNILQNPSEPKFRKIRKSNKAFQERVASLEGTEEFIRDCGFQVEMMPGNDGSDEEFWFLPESADLEHITMLQDSLRSCEPLTAELDRGLIVIKPGGEGGRNIGSLPPDFFSVSTAEVKAELQNKADFLERESMLRTQAMRDKEASVGRRKYRYCVVRIRFPDGYILQGTFSVYEQLSAVLDFVTDNLEVPLPFHLLDSVNGAKMLDMAPTLQELGLVPASILNFRWDPEIAEDLKASGANVTCLKSSLIQ